MQPPPDISPATSNAAVSAALESQGVKKTRGGYKCGQCGQSKKGHTCNLSPTPISTEHVSYISAKASSSRSTVLSLTASPSSRHSLNDVDARNSLDDPDLDQPLVTDIVPPDERRITVPEKAQSGYLESELQNCDRPIRLSLKTKSDFDASALGCIALCCPLLKVFELSTQDAAVNRISGGQLSRFVKGNSGLTSLKMEGCSNLGGFSLFSSTLSTLCLEDLHSLSMMIFNCPNLMEISLSFSRQENDSTDLVTVVNSLGSTCTRLQKFHIASLKLSETVVLALIAANFRELRMLSLILGINITDVSVAAISSRYTNLELLDLSGSSITDTGLESISENLPTLSKLLVVLCLNITANGIQFVTSKLLSLELLDCGMTLIHSEKNPYPQNLYIKHDRLKKFCLKGCSSLRTLSLNCPELIALDLSLCKNLQPESLVLNCPKIEIVRVAGCGELLTAAIEKR